MKEKIIFLSGLNGIRTLAALGVMLGHANSSVGKLNFSWSLFGRNQDGQVKEWVLKEHGVTMFFVLSGFLITYLLISEKSRTNTISIKSFYIRRMLRIWPLYYLYLFSVLFILYFTHTNINFSVLGFYMFFAANLPFIFDRMILNIEHLWSIGVEEQFYVFWPWFFKKNSVEKVFKLIFVLGLFLAVFRILVWYYYPFTRLAIFSVVNRFDCMILGGLGAILYMNKNKLFLTIINNKISQFFALFVYFLMIINQFQFFNSIIEIFLVALATLVIIIGQIEKKNRLVNFNNSIMDFLGKLSYGIYIIHPLIIYLVVSFVNLDFIKSDVLKPMLYVLIIVFLTLFLSFISYMYFEIPFLKLKNKFSIVRSSGTNTFDNFKK